MRFARLMLPLLLMTVILGAVIAANLFARSSANSDKLRDVVCHMDVNDAWGYEAVHDGDTFYFCSDVCQVLFTESPGRYLVERCVVCDAQITSGEAFPATYLGETYRLCTEEHRQAFKADPAAYFLHTMWGIPDWLYYVSIAAVLVLSFGLFELMARVGGGAGARSSAHGIRLSRMDLLTSAWLGRVLRSRRARFVMQIMLVVPFLMIVGAGLFGNQNPALNIAPILTWTVWWGLLPIWILFAGKFWCYVCPWDAMAGWTERLSLWKKQLVGLSMGWRWPRLVRNISIATILFVGLTWVELGFGVTMKPRMTAYLAIGMLLLAVVSALLFERRSFCRYGCLIGRVSGLYSLFSGVELRARESAVCSGCHTKECVRGSETSYGCPTLLYPGKLEVNTYCIDCMECVQGCPHDNLALNVRPWGSDLVAEGKPRSDEAYLALLMLAITGFHGLTMTPVWQKLVDGVRDHVEIGRVAGFSVSMLGILLAPVAVYAVLVLVSRGFARHAANGNGAGSAAAAQLSYKDYFVRYAYALLPIALFYHIAHNLEHLLMEGPKVLALVSDPLGWNWNLFGTAGWNVPPLISLSQLWGLQVLLVLIGHVYSLWVAQRTSVRLFGSPRAAFWSQLPMLVGMIAFSVFSLWLLKQPMEMRTSSM